MLIDTQSTNEMNKLQANIFYMKKRKAYYMTCYPAKLQDGMVITAITQGQSVQYGEPVGRYSSKHERNLVERMKVEIGAKLGLAWELVEKVAKENGITL